MHGYSNVRPTAFIEIYCQALGIRLQPQRNNFFQRNFECTQFWRERERVAIATCCNLYCLTTYICLPSGEALIGLISEGIYWMSVLTLCTPPSFLLLVNPCCSSPCQNRGVCMTSGFDRYECDCTRTGYYGENCTTRMYFGDSGKKESCWSMSAYTIKKKEARTRTKPTEYCASFKTDRFIAWWTFMDSSALCQTWIIICKRSPRPASVGLEDATIPPLMHFEKFCLPHQDIERWAVIPTFNPWRFQVGSGKNLLESRKAVAHYYKPEART